MGIIINSKQKPINTMDLARRIKSRHFTDQKDILIMSLIEHIHLLEAIVNDGGIKITPIVKMDSIHDALQFGKNMGYQRWSVEKVEKSALYLLGDRHIEHYMLAIWIGYNYTINNIVNTDGDLSFG